MPSATAAASPAKKAAPAKKSSSVKKASSSAKKSSSGKAARKRVIYEITDLSKTNTRRLAHKAGVKYIGREIYGDVSTFVHNDVKKLLQLCVLNADNAGKSTITRAMVLHAIECRNLYDQ